MAHDFVKSEETYTCTLGNLFGVVTQAEYGGHWVFYIIDDEETSIVSAGTDDDLVTALERAWNKMIDHDIQQSGDLG